MAWIARSFRIQRAHVVHAAVRAFQGGSEFESRSWFFCLAFLSIGLESDFRRLADQMAQGRPLILYVAGQAFNVVLTLLVVWLVFGGVLFDVNLNAS